MEGREDCGLRTADCGLRVSEYLVFGRDPQSAIRNRPALPQSPPLVITFLAPTMGTTVKSSRRTTS
jgi:hypothetical protein